MNQAQTSGQSFKNLLENLTSARELKQATNLYLTGQDTNN